MSEMTRSSATNQPVFRPQIFTGRLSVAQRYADGDSQQEVADVAMLRVTS